MPWFKIDDNLGFHHKVIAAGNPAMGLWVRAGSICAQQLTDGFVPDHMVNALGTKAQAAKLIETGLWDAAEGGYRFHGWAERQPSKADVEAERAAAANRMREFRAKKKGTTQNASPQVEAPRAEDVQPNERRTNGEVREMFGNPDPTQPIPSRPDPIEVRSTTAVAVVAPKRDDVERICEHMATLVAANGSTRPTITKAWRTQARLMLDDDKRTEADVHTAIEWCQADGFWRGVVMSLPKLRKQYDAMRLQAQRPAAGARSKQQETDDLFAKAAQRMGVTTTMGAIE
ncbi:MAG: hypothetical protein JWP74_1735 [Marmoricola sp.]|nr:hypothetical protein [Marmoricola sp.]